MKTHTRSTKCQYRPASSTPSPVAFPDRARLAVIRRMTTPMRTCVPWNPVIKKKNEEKAVGPHGLPDNRAPSWMSCVHSVTCMPRNAAPPQRRAIYPDGRKELLSVIDNFQFNWHNNYIYADHVAPLLPKGTVLKFNMWYDNTENNPSNPHPGDYVTWGDRAADEMGHMWIGVTTLTQEAYDRLVRERTARVAADEGENNN